MKEEAYINIEEEWAQNRDSAMVAIITLAPAKERVCYTKALRCKQISSHTLKVKEKQEKLKTIMYTEREGFVNKSFPYRIGEHREL